MRALEIVVPLAVAVAALVWASCEDEHIPIFDAAGMRPSAPGARVAAITPLPKQSEVTPLGEVPNDPPAERYTHELQL